MRTPVINVGRIASSLGFLLLGASIGSATDDRPKWWQSEKVKTEVGLTADQSRQLESIFQSTLPRMRLEKQELDRQEKALSRLMTEATTGEAEMAQAVDRVEAARAAASKTRMLMLYRMYRVLTPEQRVKLNEHHERHRQEKRASGSRDPLH